MLVMVVFFIAFRWIHLSTPLIRLFLLVLILLLMPTLNFLPVWFALSLLRFRLPSRLLLSNRYKLITNVRSSLMAVNIHITIIELNALHTKRQNRFQELDAVIHLLMEA